MWDGTGELAIGEAANQFDAPWQDKMDPRQRIINTLWGLIPVVFAMPFLLGQWAPRWFVVTWIAAYLANSLVFSVTTLRRPAAIVEQLWSIATATFIAALPITVVLWSQDEAHYWISATVAIIFCAFEMSTLPFLNIPEWRIGILMVGAALAICGFIFIHPVVGLASIVVLAGMMDAADRIRKLKLKLERHLAAAQFSLVHDPLTNLLNRRGLSAQVEQLADETVTIALIDVDRFKLINDSHGHQIGDEVLVAVGKELSSRLGDEFAIARLGGDEFVAVAPGRVSLDRDIAQPQRVTTKLHGQLIHLDVRFSVGVSHGLNGDSAERLLSEAGFAMREAKRTREGVARFGTELAERLDRTIEVASIANGSTVAGSFVPVAQTIVSEDRIVGCELLIRWEQPDGDLMMPEQFLPMAVEAGLMSTINEVMLEHAVRFAARFNNRAAAPFVSVNITASYLGESHFCDRVATLLRDLRVAPERLMIEITETERLGNDAGWEAAATELRRMGVRLAIDDFGTGYSSIERLQYLPITHLKFDQSLVQMVSGPFGKIAQGVASFAQASNITVIAEGIETLDELESMRSLDIGMFQGFHFHRPQSLDQVEISILEGELSALHSESDPSVLPPLD